MAAAAPPPSRRLRVEALLAAGALTVGAIAVATGSFESIAVVSRLAGWTLLVAGAAVTVARNGTVDLATAGLAAVGAYVAGVAATSLGWPPAVGLVVGTAAGATAGALAGSLAGRVGGQLAALPTLSLTLGAVAILRAWPAAGGASGFHAVPFLTGGDRGDALVAVTIAALGLWTAAGWWRSHGAALASVASRAPDVAAALGRWPALATGAAGAVAGVLLGAGGAVQATVSGSVSPGAFGLELAAALALAAVLGGRPPLGPLVGAAAIWGPSIVLPLAPVVGDAPPLLTTGAAALLLLAVRRGRPLVPDRDDRPGDGVLPAAGPPDAVADHRATARPGPDPDVAPILEVAASERHGRLTVRPGEVVAVTGPNGAGKSTLLAQIGGQLRDGGTVRIDGRPAPHGPTRRARAGIARSWQRPPSVPIADLLDGARHHAPRRRHPDARDPEPPVAAVAAALGGASDTSAVAQVVAALSTAPRVLLLDEPATTLPEDAVVRAVTLIARAGIGVVLVDHRPAVLAVADRTVVVEAGGGRT